MVTVEKDFVITPEMSKHMEDWVSQLSCTGVIIASRERAQALGGKDGSWGCRARVLAGRGSSSVGALPPQGTAVSTNASFPLH